MTPAAPPPPAGPRGRPRDLYARLMRETQAPRAELLAERERWLRGVPVEGREELLFELEVLLRGVERYFNLHHLAHGARSQPLVTRDFREELADVRDALTRAIQLARQLLDPRTDQKLVFRRYVQSQLLDDRARRALVEGELEQDSPQESLFVLRQSLDALRGVVDQLLKLPQCSLVLFNDVGNLALREIVLNRFFRPARALEFRPEYDRVKSARVLDLLAGVAEPARAPFALAFLALFRILHALEYALPAAGREGAATARRARVLLALVQSEAVSLTGFLRHELAARLTDKALKSAVLLCARDLARETDRAGRRLLVELERDPALPQETAEAFSRLLRAQAVALADALGAGLGGSEDGFALLVSPQEAAGRLRRDLWVYARLCRAAERALREGDVPLAEARLGALGRFIRHFEDGSYQLLRFADTEPFDRFALLLAELPWPPEGEGLRLRLAGDVRDFSSVLEATFSAVSRRAQLRGRAFDRAEAEALAARYAPLAP